MRVKLSIPISATALGRFLGANVPMEFTIKYICTDSREVRKGDLFVPLLGARWDGRDFIAEVIEKGARVICHRGDIDFFESRYALLRIAEYYKTLLEKLKITVAVTGSVGKTTTREFINSLLSPSYVIHTNRGNENNEIGVPLTLLTAPKETEILVLECGTNHIGELSRISRCITPDIAVITNIGTAHIGNFGSREEIARAKLEICDGMPHADVICNSNEELLRHINNRITVSLDGKADFTAYDIRRNYNGHVMSFSGGGITIKDIFFPVEAVHLVLNFAYALTVAVLCGTKEDKIREGALGITPEKLRHRYIECGSFTLLDDSYNASLESVKASLYMLKGIERPTSALLGDILELGDYTEDIHREIGRYASECGVSRLYLIGKFAKYTAAGALSGKIAPSSIFICEDGALTQMAKIIECAHEPRELILIKASHRANLSRIVNILKEGKGYD